MKKENQLLTRLARVLTGNKVEVTADATQEVVQDVVEAIVDQVQVELTVDSAEVQAALQEAAAKLEDLTAQFAELSGKYEQAQAALEALAKEKAEMIAAAAAAKLEARKAQVVAAIGTEKADGLMAATENLDDVQFNAVLSALAGSVSAEADTAMFKEVGVTAEVDAVKVVEAGGESKEMKLLRAKYGKK